MDGEMADKLKEILADEQTMAQIMAIASGISSKNSVSEQAEKPKALPVSLPKADSKTAFIQALRPLIREEKRKKLDSLETALLIASLFGKKKE